jgi:cytochrome c biogenesis protein CcmG/thiol:disulfide interchange protein DsbE
MKTSLTRIRRPLIPVMLRVLPLLLANLVFGAPLKEGDAFPDLTKFNLEGTLPDLHGQVVLVDFFASWCEPCKESFPVMEELKQKYGDKILIVAVNVDKKKADMDAFLKSHPVTFTVVRDAANKLVSEVKIPTMPSSFLLDREGRVHSFHRGFKGAETKKRYIEDIDALLK